MCGIIGAVAQRNVVGVLTEGLRRLEYRGYDSCGVAVLQHGAPRRVRSVERVANLAERVEEARLSGTLGVAHTRWATHGAPVTDNAHPIFSRDEIALVHNGIIENHEPLRDELKALGYHFESDTDTEVIAHLIHHTREQEASRDLLTAVQRALQRLRGAYAIAVFAKNEPDRVIGARAGSPLVIGVGEGGNYLASDAMALSGTAGHFIFLEEGDIAVLSCDGVHIIDRDGATARRELQAHHATHYAAELGPYRHYMQKEIFEQPDVVADATERVRSITPALFGAKAQSAFSEIDSLLLLACGTSYYSALTAKYWLESIAGIPTQVEIASEYRYRESVVNPCGMVVVVSQSGETADTLAALKHAQQLGYHHTLAICNVPHSSMMRLTELQYPTGAGPEIGVASTKAFTGQLTALFLVAMYMGQTRETLDEKESHRLVDKLLHIPAQMEDLLRRDAIYEDLSKTLFRASDFLYLGRGVHFPIALEGALKLKEISYIHAEGYPAGEMKHGPNALIDGNLPTVVLATRDPHDELSRVLYEKTLSNIQEVKAREGIVVAVACEDDQQVRKVADHIIPIGTTHDLLLPILEVVPLQMLAYHIAVRRGCDVDQPRNLAKSVTVE